METVLALAEESGYEGLPGGDVEGLRRWFYQGDSGSLERYLQAFDHTVGVMQTADALTRVAREAVVDLAATGVVYAELRFAPVLHTAGGLAPEEVVTAVAAGIRQGSTETGTEIGLILDALRQHDGSEAIARLAVDSRPLGVVGFDLAGPERGYPADHHLAACRIAREGNLGLTIHAGEADGPDSIWRALQRCYAHRLGHGVYIVDDCRLQDGEIVELGPVASYVRDHQVVLEVSVISNLHTSGWGPAEHPVGALHRAGFAITINTDNRLMSETTLDREFELLRRHHGFTTADELAVTERAMQASFAPYETKRRLIEDIIRPAYHAHL